MVERACFSAWDRGFRGGEEVREAATVKWAHLKCLKSQRKCLLMVFKGGCRYLGCRKSTRLQSHDRSCEQSWQRQGL